ncbi:MAG TPA: GGDEF domain-containing phosphodiesterase [Rhodocyclaceae bacterium]|nr:GGDEF domain-containing phosphodiesterase [Rhodocyclaceae bacterium]
MSELNTGLAENLDTLTGLPLLTRALADIHTLTKSSPEGAVLGVASVLIAPSPALYRLTQTASHQLRQAASERLKAVLRPQDRVYSLAQWEWLILLPELLSPAPLTLAMLRLQGVLHEAFDTLDGDTLVFESHCGGALWPNDGDDPIHLTQSARIARLHAESEHSGIQIYRQEMDNTGAPRAQRFPLLAQTLAGNAPHLPRLHLQPQVDLETGACTGAEALLRWPVNDLEFAPPHHVIAAIEKQGLRHNFGRWLFNQAMQILNTLNAANIPISLSVNLSAHDLLDIELPDLLAQTLATWDVPAERLLLEITETTMVEESRQVEDVLQGLRQLGVALAIDDFGTGYAGMSYLQRLPIEEVKIDQCFVRQVVSSPRNREIVASVTQLAHRLNLRVVAEGVENQATADLLRTLGCRHAQGFLYAEALPLEEFIAWYWQHPAGS